jgi:hypothetical protein
MVMTELKILVDLCLFQAKPQDFPYSRAWVMLAAIVLATAIYVSNPVQDQTSLVVALIAIVHVTAYGFAIWGVLWYRMKPAGARKLAFLGQATGLIGVVAALSGIGHGSQVAIMAILAAIFLVTLSIIFKSLKELPHAISRFVQTISAVFGTAAILQLVNWPFVNWLVKVQDTPAAQVPLLVIFGLGIWTFAVAVNINRHAMEITVGQSILVTLGVQVFAASIVFILFGAFMI